MPTFEAQEMQATEKNMRLAREPTSWAVEAFDPDLEGGIFDSDKCFKEGVKKNLLLEQEARTKKEEEEMQKKKKKQSEKLKRKRQALASEKKQLIDAAARAHQNRMGHGRHEVQVPEATSHANMKTTLKNLILSQKMEKEQKKDEKKKEDANRQRMLEAREAERKRKQMREGYYQHCFQIETEIAQATKKYKSTQKESRQFQEQLNEACRGMSSKEASEIRCNALGIRSGREGPRVPVVQKYENLGGSDSD